MPGQAWDVKHLADSPRTMSFLQAHAFGDG